MQAAAERWPKNIGMRAHGLDSDGRHKKVLEFAYVFIQKNPQGGDRQKSEILLHGSKQKVPDAAENIKIL